MDIVYRADADSVYTDQAVIHFATNLAAPDTAVTLFGRLDPAGGPAPYRIPSRDLRLVALPHYPSLTAVGRLLAAVRGSARTFAAELERLDAVWLFGPHPLSLLFALIARRRGVPVFLGVRQDFPAYIRHRLPSPRWRWALPVAYALEWAWRLLSTRMPTIAVGSDLAANYRLGSAPLLATGFSLLRADDVVSLAAAEEREWNGDFRLLSVGRLDPEKNPTLLPDVLARLRESDDRWRLAIVGDGPMRSAVEQRARELGVAGAVELLGYVPNGPALWEQYRRSHAFLHVSWTEGLPQVLWEAQGAGVPVVATDVGGVRAALDDGAGGLLVPPGDVDAAARALERLRDERELRLRLVAAGLRKSSSETLDAHLDRIRAFIRANLGRRRAGTGA